jgi:putative MATE family efflux protein
MIFGGSENTIPYAREFLRIVIPGTILVNIAYGYSSMMRASGYPKKSMYALLIGVGLNLILAPIFIFVLKLGISGAAIATTISMFVSASYVMHHFLSKNSRVRFRRHAFKLKWFIVRNVTAIGLSPFLMNVAASAVVMIANLVLRKYGGDLAIGAYSIMGGYAMLFIMITLGICQGMQPIVGYNYGAQKLKRMKDTLLLAIKVGMCINSVGLVCALLIPVPMAKLFTTDAELIGLISHGLIFVFIMSPLIGFQIVTSNFYQSISKPFLSIFMSLCRQILFFVPCLLIFSRIWGLNGVWYAITAADFLSVVVAIIVLLWQRKVFYPYIDNSRSALKKLLETMEAI